MDHEGALDRVVKAYDVRGTDDELSDPVVTALGHGIAEVLGDPGEGGGVLLAHDMRPSSPRVVAGLAEAIRSRGVDVVELGLLSTDAATFASGHLDRAAAMVTASHNPAGHNGIKLSRRGAVPVALGTGLAEVREVARSSLGSRLQPAGLPSGDRRRDDVAGAFVAHVLGMVDPARLAGIRLAVDAGNGMAGWLVPKVVADLDVTVDELYFDLDGSFPNHPANPLDASNLVDLADHVVANELPLGLAFDGDADRVFAVDERGRPVPSSLVGAVVAERLLERHPGATVLYNAICSRVVPEVVRAAGGSPIRTRVGHSLIKARMAETEAVFAVEHSGHYYFRDFFRADSGIVAALVLLEAVAESGRTLSEVVAPFDRFAVSGEHDLEAADPGATIDHVEEVLAGEASAIDHLDGLTMDVGGVWGGDGGGNGSSVGWFNLRPSNTEPVLRLNVEATDQDAMRRLRDRVMAIVADVASDDD